MEKLNQNINSNKPTFESVWLFLDKMNKDAEKRQQKYDADAEKRQQKYDADAAKRQKEAEKRQQKDDADAAKRKKELDKADKELKAQMAETDRKLDKLSKLYGGVSEGLGYAAEDYFFSAVNSTLTVDNVKYNYIIRNEKRIVGKVEQEYDILLVNDNKILVIEVKHNFHPSDVTKFVEKVLPKFDVLHPDYNNYTIFGAIAGMTMSDKTKEEAKKQGLYVFTQAQDGKSIQILNEKGFIPNEF